mmetsp:Transcript_13259/g.20748  ORF Transcript_13259/g.20748 Transcript_13259/m.20748 type:complete len:200 (-) Transcript_13259:3777-4376(-)
MLSEDEVVIHSDHVVLILLVMLVQVFQDLQFHTCLILELLLVSNDLDGDGRASLVVMALHCLAETPRTKEFYDFVAVTQVVFELSLVISLIVIIPVVEDVHLLQAFDLPLARHGITANVALATGSSVERRGVVRILGGVSGVGNDHLDYVAPDLRPAVLACIVNLVIELEDLLPFVVVERGLELLLSRFGCQRASCLVF